MLSGGAVLSPSVKTAWVEHLPGTLLIDGFGTSETGGQGQSVSAAGGPIETAPRFRVNDETTVLDDDLRPLRRPGWSACWPVAATCRSGYYRDPEKTAATFPAIDGVRWSVPGDHARIEDDGTITVLGRGSVSINTGGEKVYPEEVESALKSHPAVFDAVVVGVPDERWGERVDRGGAGPPGRDAVARRARRAHPGAARVVQGPARPGARRPDRALAVGQARLPLGARHRRRRAGQPVACAG